MSKLTYDIPYLINLDTFFHNYDRNIQKVDKRLDEYVKDPNEENIHDIRTAIRRLDASYQSSPKQIQKKKIKEYVAKSRHLFKLNSEIRDFDIIIEKLYNEGQIPEQQFEQFNKSLKKNKHRKLLKALSIAIDLKKLNVPNLNNGDSNNRNDHDKLQKKLVTRYNRIIVNFASNIEMNLPIIVNNSEKIEELHEVRKDSKKLRYLLELGLDNKDKKNENENIDKNKEIKENNHINSHNVSGSIKTLEKIQDMLGNIHDYDITIAYLKQNDKHMHTVAEKNISMIRENRYKQFVQYCKSDLL
ncbi:MAG: CHAD domain-containing protein [Nitrosopumilus sp.]|nr:CHAD domain-containing protein [Nitrosopumilus sp.]